MKKKFLKIFAVISASVCASLFSACAADEEEGTEPPSVPHIHTFSTQWVSDKTYHWHAATCAHSGEVDGKAEHTFNGNVCTVCNYEAVTINSFCSTHLDKARQFVRFVRDKVKQKEILAEEWLIETNDKDELTKIHFIYIAKNDETERAVEFKDVTFSIPVDLDDIVSGKVYESDYNLDYNTKTDTFMTFDAKECYQKTELADALFSAAGWSDSLKLFSQKKGADSDVNTYYLLSSTENGYVVKTLSVEKGDGKEETIIANLADPNKVTFATFLTTMKRDGKEIYKTDYTLEKFDDPTIDPPTPPTPPAEETITDAEVKAALEENFKSDLLTTCFPLFSVDKNNVSQEAWYANENQDGKITDATYIFNYKRSDKTSYLAVGKVKFDTPIEKKDLKDGKITENRLTKEYTFSYTENVQEERKPLADKIAEVALEGTNPNATRYIKDENLGTGSHLNSRKFTIVEIDDNKVTELSVYIKEATGDNRDDKFIENLENGDWSEISKKSYNISGRKLVA